VTAEQVNRRAEVAAVVAFVLAIAGGVLAAYGYWSDHTEVWLGVGLAVCLGGIGFGLVSWAKYLDLDEHVVQQRSPLRTTVDEQDDLQAEVDESVRTLGRRPLIAALFGGSLASLVVGFVGPIGSLGPKPGDERGRTSWSAGSRLVTLEGTPIGIDSAGIDQLATVFPEGYIGVDDSQVVLLRLDPALLTERTVDNGAVDGWVAYSKICTHAGCSVGLFGVDSRPPQLLRQLVCPCHQSVFDPVDAARPVGGPATRSLPQLPLGVDDDGYLIALSDFDRPVGPLAWDEA
jgi:ubiquinol-cytochrome c reductase iron-sulfur subunit